MNLEEKIIGDITGNFVIEAYQRGYRWSEDEIKYLLEDIDEMPDGQKYCLQPIVVKDNRGTYELIDGQQRLTTLYLIMKYLSLYIEHAHFSIIYSKNIISGIQTSQFHIFLIFFVLSLIMIK